MQGYKDLKVWQVNQDCILKFVKTSEKLPKTLVSKIIVEQLLRSLLSVGANLAEGYGFYEGAQYRRHAKIALGSAVESDHWFTTLVNLFEKLSIELVEIQDRNVEVIKMLKGLIKSISLKRESPPGP